MAGAQAWRGGAVGGPQEQGAVVTGGGEQAAVRAEGEAGDGVAVGVEDGTDGLTAVAVAQDDAAVGAGAGEALAVRAAIDGNECGNSLRRSEILLPIGGRSGLNRSHH